MKFILPWKFVTLDSTVEPSPPRETFDEAFRDMYLYVKKLLDSDQLTWQVLDTAIWIETPDVLPLFFADARDLACQSGLMDLLRNTK
jgi:hypothetical protein